MMAVSSFVKMSRNLTRKDAGAGCDDLTCRRGGMHELRRRNSSSESSQFATRFLMPRQDSSMSDARSCTNALGPIFNDRQRGCCPALALRGPRAQSFSSRGLEAILRRIRHFRVGLQLLVPKNELESCLRLSGRTLTLENVFGDHCVKCRKGRCRVEVGSGIRGAPRREDANHSRRSMLITFQYRYDSTRLYREAVLGRDLDWGPGYWGVQGWVAFVQNTT